MKRSSCEYNEALKRARGPLVGAGRLCDLNTAVDLFSDVANAEAAKEKGWLGAKKAKEKYEEYETKLLALHKDSDDIAPLDEDWLLTMLPELNGLEDETLDRLLTQSQRHSMYEKAARELVLRDRARCADEHARELARVRLEKSAEVTQASTRAELRIRQLDAEANEEHDALKTEAEEQLDALKAEADAAMTELRDEADEVQKGLEAKVEALEAELEAERRTVEYTEAKAADELAQERARVEDMEEMTDMARQEVDLKRETSRKLKEEIIDNDKLTLANLNRIKSLEQRLAAESALVVDLEAEIDELRSAPPASAPLEELAAAEGEAAELRQLLAEREAQLVALSSKMSDQHMARENGGGRRSSDSFFSRLGLEKAYGSANPMPDRYERAMLDKGQIGLGSSYA